MFRFPVPALAGAALLALPALAWAHGFGRLYNLPVPFWLYAWGASGALAVSFLLTGWFATARVAATPASRDLGRPRWLQRAAPGLRFASVACLLLCIATGFFGVRDPYRNFSMTFFWVVFVLGFAYLTALVGDFYAALNPWRVLTGAVDRIARGFARGRVRYPAALGDWPALALYLGFIWYELAGHSRPFSLATVLTAYTALNFAGVWLVGAAAWFRHCELFAVFLRLLGLMAPLEHAGQGRLRWRWPFAGLLLERPAHLATVAFALAMLATTAYDGLRSTQGWVFLFWRDPTGIVTALAGKPPILAYAQLRPWYTAWDTFWILAMPFVYLGVYLLFVDLARRIARSRRPLRELALDFGYTLLPIALVYHMTHYATLLLSQGPKVVSLLSDPFGAGWNLFGTAGFLRAPILPDVGIVWHAQVALILAGHIVSVVIAHFVALRVFESRRAAVLSQIPMLVLMVAFTISGLWILAQPLTSPTMQ